MREGTDMSRYEEEEDGSSRDKCEVKVTLMKIQSLTDEFSDAKSVS